MNRNVVLAVVAVVALALVGVVALLSSDGSGSSGSAPAVARREGGAGALPTFSADMPASERAPEALAAAAGAPPPAETPDAPRAAKPEGPRRTIAGRVVRASDGTPIPGVNVGYQADLDEATASVLLPNTVEIHGETIALEQPGAATTAEDGTFEAQVPVPTKSLVLSTSHRTHDVELPPGTQDLRNLEIVFDSGFRVAGRVVDEAGAPIPGATVEVSAASDVLSDDAGRFLVKDVAPDPADTVVQATARAPWRVRATADVIVPRDVTEMPSVELRLAGSGRIEGRVLQSDGAPAVAARVDAGFLMDTGTDSQATNNLDTSTNEDGAYDIDHVPAGRYLVRAGGKIPHLINVAYSLDRAGGFSLTSGVASTGEGEPEAWVPDVLVEAGRTTRLDLVLPVGALLAGRVLDSAGAPVAGAHVQLERLARWPTPDISGSSVTSRDGMRIEARGSDGEGEAVLYLREGRVDTDEHGRFEFTRLGAGERLIGATDPTGRLSPLQRGVVLAGGEVLDSFDLVLRTGLVMRSKVTDPTGRPLAGATVYVKAQDSMALTDDDLVARSGDDGIFEARGLTPGRKQISISLEGYSWFWGEVDPEDPPPAYVLTPAPRLRGEVVDALTGEPVQAFALTIAKENSIMQSGVQSRPGGTFDEDASDDERCDVTVDAPGYESLKLEQALPSATMTTPLRFRLQRQN